jgi:hypothetical protein
MRQRGSKEIILAEQPFSDAFYTPVYPAINAIFFT